MTLRQDSIKGNLCCNIFSKTSEENLFRVTAPNCQPDLLLSNRITTGTPLLPPLFTSCLRLSVPSSDTFWLLSSFPFDSQFTPSPFPPLPLFFLTPTLFFRVFTVTSREPIGSQTQTKGKGAMTRDESPVYATEMQFCKLWVTNCCSGDVLSK